MGAKNSHCSYCGSAFAEGQPWPRMCVVCGKTTFRNPTPVAVVVQPVDGGVLTIRRAIPPSIGYLALPGGFVDVGETWQQAGAREVWEEAGLKIDPNGITDLCVLTGMEGDRLPDGNVIRGDGTVLIFGVARPLTASDLPPFTPTNETAERTVVTEPIEMAFPLHTKVLAEHFRRTKG